MATEILNINGWDSGWPTGSVANVDEAIAGADGALISTTTENDTVLLDLTSTVIADADTVNAVDITVRCREGAGSAGNNDIGVEFLIGGSVQGSQRDTAQLTTSFQNLSVSDVAWDSDWTAAQLNGAQVRLDAKQSGMPSSATWEVDCIDVVIDYTPAAGHGRLLSSERNRLVRQA